jgi:integrase
MPYELYRPGTRKNNKYWVVRGSVEGKDFEASLKTTDKERAQERADGIVKQLRRQILGSPFVSFSEAADNYIKLKNPGKRDLEWILKACQEIGEKDVKEVCQTDIIKVADRFYPNAKAASKNRAVLRPIAAVVHQAARNDKEAWWRRFEAFKEPKRKARPAPVGAETTLIEATRGDPEKHILMLWLFRHGQRITETIEIKFEHVDFKRHNFRILVSKNDEWQSFPLDPEVEERLKELAASRKAISGYIFPWRNRWAVYRWLTPLCESLSVKFTPHQGRHTVGVRFKNAGLQTRMSKLGHKSVAASMIYDEPDLEAVRAFDERTRAGKA